MKNGDLVRHNSLGVSEGGLRLWESSNFGVGIIVESWENQVTFEGVPDHDPDDRIVLFDSGYKVIKTHDLELV